VHIEAPATIDGGDVLRVGRRLYVGLSKRSTPQGIDQLAAILAPHGYSVQGVEMDDCLHLKSAVTQVGPDSLLINRQWVDEGVFAGYDLIDIDPSEPMSGNALYLSEAVIYPAEHPATRQRLEAHGIRLVIVPAGELAKVEGGVTCCSLILEV
jgi:dimethylargininase